MTKKDEQAYEQVLAERMEKFNTTPEVIKRATRSFYSSSISDDPQIIEDEKAATASGATTLQDFILYFKAEAEKIAAAQRAKTAAPNRDRKALAQQVRDTFDERGYREAWSTFKQLDDNITSIRITLYLKGGELRLFKEHIEHYATKDQQTLSVDVFQPVTTKNSMEAMLAAI